MIARILKIIIFDTIKFSSIRSIKFENRFYVFDLLA
jgi:hypothetical protein